MSETLTISPRIVDLICSRICHDLISPVSAINNGIELISETDEGVGGDAFSLIEDSARIVAARLALMRYAFGAATPSLDEVREVALAYFADSKINLQWPKMGLGADITQRPGLPKLLLNIVLVQAESIGASGQITLQSLTPNELLATAEPRAGNVRADILVGLDSANADTLDARTIQAYVTGMLAKRFGFNMTKSQADNKIVFHLT